jgi:hypothetical protein
MKFSKHEILDFLIAFLIVTLFVVALAHSEEEECSFFINLENNTDEMVIYRVAWDSHPFVTPNPYTWGPVYMMIGELQPGTTVTSAAYSCGSWTVSFESGCVDYYHAFIQEEPGEVRTFTVPDPQCSDEI